MTKKSIQKYKYLENDNSFYDEIEAFFIIFKGLSFEKIKQILLGRWESDFKCFDNGNIEFIDNEEETKGDFSRYFNSILFEDSEFL